MPFAATDVLYGFVVPAIAAAIGAVVLRRALPGDVGDRYAASIAFATVLLVGYGLLDLGHWAPTSHWHWLPYAVAIAAILGPATGAAGLRSLERVGLYAVIAFIAAWHLAPTWEDLEPSRSVQLATWTLLVTIVAAGLYHLPRFVSGQSRYAVLAAVCLCGAAVLFLGGNGRFAQTAGLAAGACAGLAVASIGQKSMRDASALPMAIFLCSAMWIGHVNTHNDVPLVSYVLVTLSPMMLWALAVGPLANLSDIKRTVAAFVIGVALAGVAVAIALNAEPFEPDVYSEYSQYGDY